MLSVILVIIIIRSDGTVFCPILAETNHQASSALPFSQHLPQLLIRRQVLWILAFTISPIVIVFL